MKFRILIAGVMALALAACGKSSTAETPRPLTEHDFAADPTLSLQPGQVGVTFLEAVDAGPTGLPDTRIPGLDIIPFEVTEEKSYSYALDEGDGAISHAVIATGDAEAVLLDLTPASPTGSVVLKPGRYALLLVSGNTVEQNQGEVGATVFFQSAEPPEQIVAGAPRMLDGVSPKFDLTSFTKVISRNGCRGCDLSGANLANAPLINSDLVSANLTGADLSSAQMLQANLSGANLTGANLTRTFLLGGNLSNANLTSANLTGADLRFASFTGAKLLGPNLILTGVNLGGAQLGGVDLSTLNLSSVDLSNARLAGVNLTSANLTGATMTGAELVGANLTGANLTNADLRYAILESGTLIGANLSGATLAGANLSGATWTDGKKICAQGSIGECK